MKIFKFTRGIIEIISSIRVNIPRYHLSIRRYDRNFVNLGALYLDKIMFNLG